MSRTTNFKKLAEDVEMYLKIQTNKGGAEAEEAIIFKDAVRRLATEQFMTYEAALEKVLKGQLDYDLLRELSIAKAARLVSGVDIATSIERILDSESALWNTVKGQNETTVNSIRTIESQRGPKAAIDDIERRLNLLKNSSISPEMKKYWEEFYKPLRKEMDDAKQIDSQISGSNIDFDDAELAAIRDSESSVKVPEGPIKKYLEERFSRFGDLTDVQQKDLVEEMGAKVAGFFEKTYSKMTQQGESFDTIQKMFDDKRIPPAKRRQIMLDAIKKSNTSLGAWQDSLDWLVKYLTGFDMETKAFFWSTGEWKTVMKNWFLINAGFGVMEFFLRGYLTREEDRESFGNNDVDIFLNRFDIVGLLLRLIPIPTIARLAISEAGQAMIEAGGNRKPTPEEVKHLGTRNDPKLKPDYNQYVDLLTHYGDRCTWVKGFDGKDMGVWTYDLKEGLKQIVPGEKGTPSPNVTTKEYGESLNDFKQFLKDNNMDSSNAENDTGDSGFWKSGGKDYEYNSTSKTYIEQ